MQIVKVKDAALVLSTPRPLDQNPAAVYIGSLRSDHSKRNMRRYLDQMAALVTGGEINDALALRWENLRYQHTQAIPAHLVKKYASATVNGMLSALRGVLKEAWRLELMSAEDYQRASDIKSEKRETLPSGRELNEGEIMALANACLADSTPAGARDAAIIALLYTCGMRRSEVAKLTTAEYDSESGEIRVISGKRNKDRKVYATNGTKDALDAWLAVRGVETGPLFVPVNKGGVMQFRPMNSQAIYVLCEKRAKEASVKDFSPHDFRRTFVGDLLERGVDIATVANMAGHASVETTRRYDRRPDAVKKLAAEKLHFPFRRPG